MSSFEKKDTKTEFWNWFVANEAAVKGLLQKPISLPETYDKLCKELSKFSPDIYPELTIDDDNDYNLIITADGRFAGAECVDDIVSAAPDIPNWKIIRFRQPTEHFTVEVNEMELRADSIRLWRRYDYENRLVDLRLFIENYDEELQNAIFLCMDHTLGEELVIGVIDTIEFADLNEMTDDFNAIDLVTLRIEVEEAFFSKAK